MKKLIVALALVVLAPVGVVLLATSQSAASATAATPSPAATGWSDPVETWTPSATFHEAGSAWHMCGWHTGYDYAAPVGTVVRAAAAGTVVHAGWGSEPGGTGSAYGNQVIIDHGGEVRSYYAHLSEVTVAVGQVVEAGTQVGLVGVTGNSFGPHLHVEVTTGTSGSPTCDSFVDPRAWIDSHRASAVASGAATSRTAAVVAAARAQLGQPYSLGGGSLDGPTAGYDGRVGWDCSALVRYAWFAGAGVTLPRTAQQQGDQLAEVPWSAIQPGDLIVFALDGGGWSHVGLYIGDGQMIHAPNPTTVVKVVSVTSGYYATATRSVRRPS